MRRGLNLVPLLYALSYLSKLVAKIVINYQTWLFLINYLMFIWLYLVTLRFGLVMGEDGMRDRIRKIMQMEGLSNKELAEKIDVLPVGGHRFGEHRVLDKQVPKD